MGEKVYGLLGRKLGHSWSAPIHAALGCADYRLIELEPEELGAFLAREDIGGLNVTIPYKRDVMAYCDVLDPMAEAIGSVNTLVRRADGKLYGYNTDAAGFCFMAQRAGIGFAGKKTLVLGSGGASRTAAACAKRLGAREVVVISRSGENNYTNLGRHADAERIVNTTPVGMYPNNGAAAVDLTAFPTCAGVLDLIYNPRRTALLLQAEALGIPRSDGLPMLVAQAKAAEEHFFDRLIADSENERILAQLRREMTNLVLIGMPGSGKSSLGRRVASNLGLPFIDTDQRIEQSVGCSTSDIFAHYGEQAFRNAETNMLIELSREQGSIVSTGGGLVLRDVNREIMRNTGVIVLLDRPLEEIMGDIKLNRRPLLAQKGLGEVERLYNERIELYRKAADATLDNSHGYQAGMYGLQKLITTMFNINA